LKKNFLQEKWKEKEAAKKTLVAMSTFIELFAVATYVIIFLKRTAKNLSRHWIEWIGLNPMDLIEYDGFD
jgi:hypothetical protein